MRFWQQLSEWSLWHHLECPILALCLTHANTWITWLFQPWLMWGTSFCSGAMQPSLISHDRTSFIGRPLEFLSSGFILTYGRFVTLKCQGTQKMPHSFHSRCAVLIEYICRLVSKFLSLFSFYLLWAFLFPEDTWFLYYAESLTIKHKCVLCFEQEWIDIIVLRTLWYLGESLLSLGSLVTVWILKCWMERNSSLRCYKMCLR